MLAFAVGCIWVALSAVGWYWSQRSLALYDQGELMSLVLSFYLVEALSICIVVCGVYLIYRGLVGGAEGLGPDTIRGSLSGALSSSGDLRIGAVAALVYGLLYLVVSSMLVYQPGVDFSSVYGVSATSWAAAACCGSPWTVPALVVYLLPGAHLALQVLPLDALFAVIVPILVGMNVTVAAHSFRNRALRTNAGWLGSVGVIAGLFTGCPTCAGLFLAGALGGLGATTLAVALAPYQVLFVLVSIPLLLASPLVIAEYSRRTLRACAVPGAAGGPS